MDKNSNILVTGGNGLVGSYIIRILIQNGYSNIYATIRKNSQTLHINDFIEKIHVLDLDIRNPIDVYDAMATMEVVFHAAAMVSYSASNENEMFEVNVEGTTHLVNAALEFNIRKFIFISSVAALGRASEVNVNMDETTEWKDSKYNSPYALSKYLAEKEVWRAQAEGLNTSIISPSIILGEGNFSQSSLQMYRKVKMQSRFYPKGSTGFVDVRDVASIALKTLEMDTKEVKFIANAENKSFKEVMFLMAENLRVSPPISSLPEWLGWGIATIEKVRTAITGGTPLITHITLISLRLINAYTSEKSQSILNHAYIPIETTIRESCAIFSGEKKGPLSFETLL